MKKTIVLAIALLLVLTACNFNPFSKGGGEDNGNTVQTEPPTHEYMFVVAIEVPEAQKDAFTRALQKRLEAYGYEGEEDKVELQDSKNIKVTVKEKSGVIFLEDEFIQYMLNTPTFEIRSQEDKENLVITDEEKAQLKQYNSDARAKAESLLQAVIANPETFADAARENSEDPGSAKNGGAYTGIKKGQFVPEYENVIFGDLEVGSIYPEVVETDFGYHIIKKDGERGEGDEKEVDTSHILISKQTEEQIIAAKQWIETGLVGYYIDIVNPVQQSEDSFAFQILFDENGAKLLSDITKDSIGKQIAIFIDGVGIGAPNVENEITNGELVITGDFSQDGVIAISKRLSGGVIQYPLQLPAEKQE